ncbi:MAG: hypothetical protein AB1465_03825 [Patescibacteria group bacterium]
MRKYRRSFRGEVGSVLYWFIYLGLLGLGYKLFGLSILDGVILAILGLVVYVLVGFLLRKIGFWRY